MDWRTVRYDAIVVGSGAAGAIAAKFLTDGGATVLVLEAGPELSLEACREQQRSRHDFEIFRRKQPVQSRNLLYNQRNCHLFVDDLNHPYATDGDTKFNWIRSRQAGGRTLLWSRFALRMCQADLTSSAQDGIGIAWPVSYRELAPYYDRVEALTRVQGTVENLPSLPDGQFLPRYVPRYIQELRERLENHYAGRHMIPSREVSADHEHPDQAHPPAYSSLSILDQCNRQKLTFRTDCVVVRVELDSPNHAKGVVVIDRVSQRGCEISARVILLCASTIESTRILLASANRDFPTGLGNSSGVLGHFLMDQFGGPRMVAAGRIEDAAANSRQRVYLPRFTNLKGHTEEFLRGYGIQGEFQVGEHGNAVLNLGVFGEVLPCFDNLVILDESTRDADGLSCPRIRFRYGDNERKMAAHAQSAITEIVDALGFRPLVVHDDILPGGTRAHELGTARMGTNPKESVLNPYNRCWDIDNLFVTDGSCFPASGYKGPTLTIMALTARACQFISSQFRAGAFR